MDELFEIFAVDGKIPEMPKLVEGVDYFPNEGIDPLSFQKGNRASVGNKGNRKAIGPPKGSTNNIKQYWYKTPTQEGTCTGKGFLVEIGFPPSIDAKGWYKGGTSSRNMKWKGYEFGTLNPK